MLIYPIWLPLLWYGGQALAIMNWIDWMGRMHRVYFSPVGAAVLAWWCFLIGRGLYRWRRSRPT
nr:hypothetical protein [uncultured Rhodopila sp.]